MTVKTKMIKDFAQIGFDRLESATKNMKPDQLDWKSCTQANTIRWILTHLSEELNVYMPKFLGSEQPKDWPKDYIGNPKYKQEKILADIAKGLSAYGYFESAQSTGKVFATALVIPLFFAYQSSFLLMALSLLVIGLSFFCFNLVGSVLLA